MAKISVIVPAYKVEKYLARCIDSILDQTFTDFELILVDDGSPDNCGKICDEYAEKDCRIHVIHKENGGLSDARNAGLDWVFANSNSEWVTFIDSDDWVDKYYLEYLYNSILTHKTKLAVCNYEKTYGEELSHKETRLNCRIIDVESFYAQYQMIPINACGKLIPKVMFRELRFPVGKLHEDVFLIYKILFQFDTISVVENKLYAYYQSMESIMRKTWSPERLVVFEGYEEQLAFFKHNGYLDAYKKAIDSIAYTYCDHIYQIGSISEYQQHKKYLRKKLRIHLWKYKQLNGFSIKKNPMYYECAYPTLMKYYWIITSQLNKLKRKKNV